MAGSGWRPAVGGGAASGNTTSSRAQVATDVGVSGTTLSNTTGLSFAIGANETWLVTAYLTYTSATTGGIKVGATVPSGATGRLSVTAESTSGANAPGSGTTTTLATGTSPSFTGTSSGGTCIVAMTVINSTTPGTVQLQHAEGSASGTTTVLATSYMVAIKV